MLKLIIIIMILLAFGATAKSGKKAKEEEKRSPGKAFITEGKGIGKALLIIVIGSIVVVLYAALTNQL